MMHRKVVTVSQIQKLDRAAIEICGVPSLILMENAGAAVSRELMRMVGSSRAPVSVFCGGENNAGDGFVAARHLSNAGYRVKVFIAGDPKRLKPDAAVNYQILVKSGMTTQVIPQLVPAVVRQIRRSALCIDAFFGVGLNRNIEPPFDEIIQAINRYGRRILAIDIPSGLDGTTGKIRGVCVRADTTVTMTLPKKGFYRNSGPQYCGRVVVADIGIPHRLIPKVLK